jgi:hypothetical protein
MNRNLSSHQEGEGDASGLAILALIGLAIWGGSSIFFGEREGFIKYEDCREVIRLQPDTLQKYYKTFTCSYRKTKSGKHMGGVCVHVDSAGTLFSASNACTSAYVYQAESQNEGCKQPAYPYLGYDDQCHKEPQ